MPLERARDSYQNLLDLQAEKQREEQRQKRTSSASSSGDTFEWLDISTPSSCESAGHFFDDSLPYYESGGDISKSERILPLEAPSRRKKLCDCCLAPWNTTVDEDDSVLPDTPISPNERTGGIVRRASIAVQLWLGGPAHTRKSFRPKTYQPRPLPSRIQFHVRFAPTKSTVTIKPWQCMSPQERQAQWWQRNDFDAFKHQMTILVQSEEHREICQVWLSNQPGKKRRASAGMNNGTDETSTSWWHKYDHSRRGLERYISSVQAKQTLESYKTAIRVVLREQWWQRLLFRRNPERLAQLYHEYTAWSRDLALAAGASDADAVQCDFDDSKRKSREYFLLKQIYKSDHLVHKHMPDFMLPSNMIHPKGFLTESLTSTPSPPMRSSLSKKAAGFPNHS